VVTAVALVVVIGAEIGARLVEDSLPPLQYDPPRLDQKAVEIDSVGAAEVIFLGSSMVEVAVEPSLFIDSQARYSTAYNAAVENASPRLWQMWLDDVVIPGLDPKVVVIGVSSFTFNDNGANDETFIDTYRKSPARGPSSLTVNPRTWSTLYKRRRDLRNPDVWQQLVGGSGETPAFYPLGYNDRVRNRPYEVPDYYRERTVDGVLNDYSSGGHERAALEALVAALQSRQITPLLVIMPAVMEDHVPMHPNGLADFDRHFQIASEIAASAGIVVLRPPAELSDRSYFVDPVHLNGTGSDLFTGWIAGELERLATAGLLG
jgi:hypothetical protein